MTDELVDLWRGNLAPVSPDSISPDLPGDTVDFLTTVGLPTVINEDIAFVRDDRLSRPVEHLGRQYVIVAADSMDFRFGVDLATGAIERIYGTIAPERRFVNSTLPLFLLTLGRYEYDFLEFVSEDPDERMDEGLERLEQLIEERDPPAAADETYWRILIDELPEG
jgi:hypothetical protein